MRYLYYCNSAYQLLNAMNLHHCRLFNNFENIKNYEGDLLLLNVFYGVEEIANILDNNGFFNRVFVGNRVYKQGKFHIVQNIFDIVFPSNFIYKANSIGKNDVYDKYDYLVVPKFSTITAAIWKMNKNAKLQLYEDGLGTYTDNVSLNPNSKTYKLLYRAFNYQRTFNDYENLYLNDLSLYIGTSKRVKPMPKISKELLIKLSVLFKDFGFGSNKKFIWFDQGIDENIREIIRNSLLTNKNEVFYCAHPRHPKYYYDFAIPNRKQIWELACLDIEDINKKCLLTIYSTAVFTPKILYDFEPYVLLAYKLTDEYKNGELSSLDEVINRFVSIYSDKTKIMIPRDRNELVRYVEIFNKNIQKV